jgi:hypothetical protein
MNKKLILCAVVVAGILQPIAGWSASCTECKIYKNGVEVGTVESEVDNNGKCKYDVDAVDCGSGYTKKSNCGDDNNRGVFCNGEISILWDENSGGVNDDGKGEVDNSICTYGGELKFPSETLKPGSSIINYKPVFAGWKVAKPNDSNIYAPGATLDGGCTKEHLGSVSNGETKSIKAHWCDIKQVQPAQGDAFPVVKRLDNITNECQYYVKCNAGYYHSGNYHNQSNTTTEVGDLKCDECPSGYYCPGPKTDKDKSSNAAPTGCDSALKNGDYDGRCKCPIGGTSAAGSQAITACKIVGNTPAACEASDGGCTKFCDNYGCFYLPYSVGHS